MRNRKGSYPYYYNQGKRQRMKTFLTLDTLSNVIRERDNLYFMDIKIKTTIYICPYSFQ